MATPRKKQRTKGTRKRPPSRRLAPERVPDALEKFLAHYRQLGTFYLAAQAAGIGASTVKDHIKDDPVFAEKVRLAVDQFSDDLEKEAYRRAVEGVSEPVYQKGVCVGYIQRYSDRLLELALKRHRPEWRDRQTVDMHHTGGVLVVPTPPEDAAAWERIYNPPPSEKGNGNGNGNGSGG